jgi:hypothetical protein
VKWIVVVAFPIEGFHSERWNGYNRDRAVEFIGKSIKNNETVILDASAMSAEDVADLHAAELAHPEWIGKIIWFTP